MFSSTSSSSLLLVFSHFFSPDYGPDFPAPYHVYSILIDTGIVNVTLLDV